jgi:hypothetical protein
MLLIETISACSPKINKSEDLQVEQEKCYAQISIMNKSQGCSVTSSF